MKDIPILERNLGQNFDAAEHGGTVLLFAEPDALFGVRMSHLLRAARSEYANLEKPLTDSEVAGWV